MDTTVINYQSPLTPSYRSSVSREKASTTIPLSRALWTDSLAGDCNRAMLNSTTTSSTGSDFILPQFVSPSNFWNTGISTGPLAWSVFDGTCSSPAVGLSPSASVDASHPLLLSLQSECVDDSSQFTQMMATLHLLTESTTVREEQHQVASDVKETHWTFSPYSGAWQTNGACPEQHHQRSLSQDPCYPDASKDPATDQKQIDVPDNAAAPPNAFSHPYEYKFGDTHNPISPTETEEAESSAHLLAQTSPPGLSSAWQITEVAATGKPSSPPSPASSATSSTTFEASTPLYPSFKYFNPMHSPTTEKTVSPVASSSHYSPVPLSTGLPLEASPAGQTYSAVSNIPSVRKTERPANVYSSVQQSRDRRPALNLRGADVFNYVAEYPQKPQLSTNVFESLYPSSKSHSCCPPVEQLCLPDGEPRLKLRLNRRNGRPTVANYWGRDSNCGSGPTYWGMWEDERSRMVYVSWLPRCARATNRSEKKRCELVLKNFIQVGLNFHGLEKVLLFPPSSAHCKLLFASESRARAFLNVFGGLEEGPGPTWWKILVCKHFQVDIRDGIYSTRVRIIWADQTKNDAEGLTVRLALPRPDLNRMMKPTLRYNPANHLYNPVTYNSSSYNPVGQ